MIHELLDRHGGAIIIHISSRDKEEREARFKRLNELGILWQSGHPVFPTNHCSNRYPSIEYFRIERRENSQDLKLTCEGKHRTRPKHDLVDIFALTQNDWYEIF